MSKVVYNQHTATTLQTAKYMLQWRILTICGFSLQLTAISFCSGIFFSTVLYAIKSLPIPIITGIQRITVVQEIHCNLSTANCNRIFCSFPFRKAQLHTAITPTTPFRGVGVVAVQCCAVSVSVFHHFTFQQNEKS